MPSLCRRGKLESLKFCSETEIGTSFRAHRFQSLGREKAMVSGRLVDAVRQTRSLHYAQLVLCWSVAPLNPGRSLSRIPDRRSRSSAGNSTPWHILRRWRTNRPGMMHRVFGETASCRVQSKVTDARASQAAYEGSIPFARSSSSYLDKIRVCARFGDRSSRGPHLPRTTPVQTLFECLYHAVQIRSVLLRIRSELRSVLQGRASAEH
jgi:hypothetical protein